MFDTEMEKTKNANEKDNVVYVRITISGVRK